MSWLEINVFSSNCLCNYSTIIIFILDLKEGLLRLQCMISKATPPPSPTHAAPNILAIQSP